MAVQRFKISLNNAVFPLVSNKAPRAVFIPQLDIAPRQNRGFTGTDDAVDFNLAQVIYGENFMPIGEGVRSVGYESVIAPTVNNDFDSIFALRDDEENTVLYSPSKGKNYIYDDVAEAWSTETIASIWAPTVLDPALDPALSRVTYAYVDGKTFVCYSRLKSNDATPIDMSIMQWDPATKTLTPATSVLANVPFAAGEIDGIAASNGFLLIWSGLSVAWAPFNGTAFDYTPFNNGQFTGAGNQIPEDVKGRITALVSVPGGFIIFTTKNAIAANYYAQSISSPWVFREIPSAGGLEFYEQATVYASLGEVYAYTTAGLQKISLNSAEVVYPEISDFIAGRETERYDFGTHTLERGSTSVDLYVKVTSIATRYVVVSYGYYPGVFSYALVIDVPMKRWGKLRIVHRDAFYWTQKTAPGPLTYSMMQDVTYADAGTDGLTYESAIVPEQEITNAQHSLAFLTRTGEVKIAIWTDAFRETTDQAVVVIGRVQLTRSSHVQFNRAEAEGLQNGNMLVAPSYNGRNLETPIPLIDIERDERYLCQGELIDCKNFNLIVEGHFNLTSLILEATTSGRF